MPGDDELVEYVAQALYERFAHSSWPAAAIPPVWATETHPRKEGWRALARLVLPPVQRPWVDVPTEEGDA